LISCDLQFHVLEKHVVHFIFNYNPYSIVNELPIAKIGGERNPLLLSPLMLAVTTLFLRGTCTTRWGGNLFRLDRKPLVELIGIEPTTPCLQSRCSPS
jgi:hypothetical protein